MKIKREDDEAVVVADASEEDTSCLDASDPPPPPTISVNSNNKLTPKQALECKYPPGCRVYFSMTTNVVLLLRHSTYEARVGVVMAVYFDFKSRDVVYEILIETTTINNERLFLLEEQLTFATNCQVMVKGANATELGVEGLVGIIVCPQLPTHNNNNNNNKSYTIQFTVNGGSRVIGMCNVDPKDVVYVPQKSCNEDDDDDDDDRNGGMVENNDINSLATGEGREIDKTNDNVHNDIDDHSSNVQIHQSLLTPLVSCDSASSSLISKQLQQEEAELLNIRQDVSRSFDKSRAVGTSSFEYTQNGTIHDQTKKQLSWEPPSNRMTASEDKQYCLLHVHEDKNMEVTFEIPHDCARYIVGRGGKTMAEIEQNTGCHIDIEGKQGTSSAVGMRTVALTAHNLAAISECRSIIEKMISKKRMMDFLPSSTALAAPNVDVEDSRVFKKIFIPTDHNPGYNYKALIIGPNGKNHQELVASCGGEISISVRGIGINYNRKVWNGSTDEPIHVILDGTKASVDKAERLIKELLDTEKARFLDTMDNRKRKSLDEVVPPLPSDYGEPPRKSCKVMGKTITLTIPSWVMKNGDLNCHLIGDIDMISVETACSVRISHDNYGTPQIIIRSKDENRGLGRARRMVEDSIIELLNDENSNGRLRYDLATTASGSINFDHIRTSDGFVLQEKPTRVWMKLIELPYTESNGGRKYHGKFLLHRQLQDEMIHGTDCVKRIYAFRDEPIWCEPYILISGQRKEEVIIVAERVDDKLRTFAADKPYLIYP